MIDQHGKYLRLDTHFEENVHVMATHLEQSSQYGGIALDAEQAQQVAQALRTMASSADMTAVNYNHVLDQLEHHEALDAHYLELGRRVRKVVLWVLFYSSLVGLAIWLR